MQEIIPMEIKETMREKAYSLLEIMILEEFPFRLVLWNNNNWDKHLPEDIMMSFPSQLVLDIKEMALEDSFVDESTGDIVITTLFEGEEYSKVILYDEIVAILDLQGQPYILNNFEQEVVPDKVFKLKPKTKIDLLALVVAEGIPATAATKSIDAFMKNNPTLNKNFK